PDSIDLTLYANGEAVQTVAVSGTGDTWTHTFTGLNKYDAGELITYTVSEAPVAGYETTYSEDTLTVTNTHNPETVNVSGTKTWNDDGNRDGKRPEAITVNLLKNGNVIDTITVTEAQGWSWSFEALPRFENGGNEIVYSVTENAVEGYTASYSGYDITNSYTPEELGITVFKLWADDGDRDGIRPDSIDLTLYANGEAVQTVAVSGTGDTWTHTFTGLNKYDAGELITYTVSEAPVAGYETTYSEDTLTVTNTHDPETVNVSGTKTWNDDGNRDGKRPEAITVNLLQNGNVIDTITVTEAQGWSWSFEALPRFENGGNEIVYSVTENAVEGYTASYSGYDITNSYTPEELGITVVKSWEDGNDRDGIRPDSVTVVLIANGRETDETLELSAENNWTASFTGLAKYSSGVPVEYSVKEISVAGYGTVISGNVTEGFTVTNTHEPETVNVSGTKFWNDDNNRDGIRPERITVKILADGVEVAQIESSRVNDWNYSLELPRYRDGGVEIVYTVAEEPVEGYTDEYDGYDVTNTHESARTELGVTKTWVDGNDNDGIRPDSVTVELYADGVATGKTLTLSEENGWAGKFEQLVKFSSGKEIVYSAVETDVPEGYTVTYAEIDGSVNVINTHESETVSLSVTKVWSDGDNAAELRPESVTVNLIADGVATGKSLVLSGENGWTGKFEQLAKFASGKEIIYTVTEDAVENYTAEITGDAETGFTVTNYVVDVPAPPNDDPVDPPADPPAEDPDVPYTGAKTMLGLWSALALASLAGLGASVMLLRKKREN
ncbi:MAG: Cna B-type domain-containing protein, partial [Ruminococcaceae bacterium]|nr:Cna B-type domain-containing protein [Oscillospiraceae bacterium]